MTIKENTVNEIHGYKRGVSIPRMPYPTECSECELVQNKRCPFTWDEVPTEGKPEDCPVEEMRG